MAYKDVMMLNDEEVSLHLHACIYVKDFMCSSACVLHVHVPLLYWAPLFQWPPLLDMGFIYYSWQCCIPSSNLYIIIIWQCTGLMQNNPFNLEYSGGMISLYCSFTGSLPVRLCNPHVKVRDAHWKIFILLLKKTNGCCSSFVRLLKDTT